MFLLLRFFNSFLFLVINASVGLYTLHRFFRAMRTHHKLVNEVEEFSDLIDESRSSLNFVGTKLMEAMKEVEQDIGNEVYVTHKLTKLSEKVAVLTRRYNELEEGIIELARLSHNMDNAIVETPADINEEVRRIMLAIKHKTGSPGDLTPMTPQSPRKNTSSRLTRSFGVTNESNSQPPSPNTVSKFSVQTRQNSPGSKSPNVILPEVTLLHEQRNNAPDPKPIGFRPPWMCQI